MQTWVLITGASEGIGRELAKLFAANKFNLTLVARNEERLKQLAAELKSQHGVAVKILAKDLSVPSAPVEIFEAVREPPIGILVNNAGFGWQGAFAESEEEKSEKSVNMIQVNVLALVQLCHLFLKPMLAARQGRILNVASTAAFQPGPFTNIYYASKAFVFSFSVALAEELRGSGVSVTTLCPGPTETQFQGRAKMKRAPKMLGMMSAEAVARAGYEGCMKGKGIVIPGLTNKMTSAISRRLPPHFTARMVRRINGH
jgi:short-subunit dehydrogenase